MTTTLTWDQVLAWRTGRHLLSRPEGPTTTDVVRRLAGVQAQVSSAAEQAIACRRPAATADVAGALADRTLVRTWAQRGTLHLLPADHAPAYLSLVAEARTWLKPAWQREFATAAQTAAIAEATAGAELTREELAAEIVEPTGDTTLGELFAENGPLDPAALDREIAFLETVLGTSPTPSVVTV